MKNSEIARVFTDMADLLELKSENQFKIRAYQRAARSIEHLSIEAEQVVREDSLREIPGVGDAIAAKITELVNTGKLTLYEKLKAEFPEGVTVLLLVPGIGPKKAYQLATKLGMKTVDELEEALSSGRVAELPRIGEKTAENILQQVLAFRRKDQRIPIGEALPIVDDITSRLAKLPGLKNISPAGSLRRFLETIGDIYIMGTADDSEKLVHVFTGFPVVIQVLASGSTKGSVIVAGGLQVDLGIVDHDSFGSSFQYFTGSKQHNIDLRERASKQGLSLSEYGITVLETGKLEKFGTEEAFYNRLGLQYIPPEIRECGGEIEMAAEHALPALIERVDIRGDIHSHTDWSDGNKSIEEMALAAKNSAMNTSLSQTIRLAAESPMG
jgi:DNA polymerase (family X)